MSWTVGSPTYTGWKRRSRAASFSMCWRYSSSVVAPTARSSPRASIGLSRLAASTAPWAAPGADDRVELVEEQDDRPLGVGDFLQHRLQAFLELAPVGGTRDQPAHVERDHAAVPQRLGHVAADDPLGQALDDRRLAHAGLADQDGVVLGAPAEDLDHPADLVVAADDRVELALLGDLGQVAPEALQWGLLLLLGLAGWAPGGVPLGDIGAPSFWSLEVHGPVEGLHEVRHPHELAGCPGRGPAPRGRSGVPPRAPRRGAPAPAAPRARSPRCGPACSSISCSRCSTRSTPARFSPSSAVISWMRLSFSTSSWEYRRVPFDERWGSISPLASYMRSVWGCRLASSAATEIMNTPRSVSTSTRVTRCACAAATRSRPSAVSRLPAGRPRVRTRTGAVGEQAPRGCPSRASWRAPRRPSPARC